MADQPDNEPLGPAFAKLAAVLLVGFIAPVLDLTIVNVAVATIGRDLQASVAPVQWPRPAPNADQAHPAAAPTRM